MPKTARAYWKGYLRLSLVTIGVELYNAVESKSEISFRQIHKPSGKRVQYQKVVEGIGEIDNSEIVKGYEVDTDTYVAIEPDDINALKLESKKTIDLVQFVDAQDIDFRYFERPYFMTPADKISGEGYIVIRNALQRMRKVGLAQATIGGREWLVAVAPLENGLIMEMMRYEEELRKPSDYFKDISDIDPDKELVELAVQLIDRKSAPFEPGKFKDHYQDALRDLIKDKLSGRKIVAPFDGDRPTRGNVVDLMEALRRSISSKAGDSTKPKPKPKPKTKPKARQLHRS